MKTSSRIYLDRMKEMYKDYDDNDSLMALAEIESMEDRARELKIYREQPKTMELIMAALKSYRECLERLANHDAAKTMTDEDRAYLYAKMDWARFTLDIVGEDPARVEQGVDSMVETYAERAGVIHS